MKTFFSQEIILLSSQHLLTEHIYCISPNPHQRVRNEMKLCFTQLAPILPIHLRGGKRKKQPNKQENKISQLVFPLCNIYNCLSKLSQNFHGHKAVSEEQQYRAPIMLEASGLQPTRTSSSVGLQYLYIGAKSELAYVQYLPLTDPSFERRLPLLLCVLVYHIII